VHNLTFQYTHNHRSQLPRFGVTGDSESNSSHLPILCLVLLPFAALDLYMAKLAAVTTLARPIEAH